ncbi:MAG: hypothetical protein ABI851_09215 [Saprospiraceae bacterium]
MLFLCDNYIYSQYYQLRINEHFDTADLKIALLQSNYYRSNLLELDYILLDTMKEFVREAKKTNLTNELMDCMEEEIESVRDPFILMHELFRLYLDSFSNQPNYLPFVLNNFYKRKYNGFNERKVELIQTELYPELATDCELNKRIVEMMIHSDFLDYNYLIVKKESYKKFFSCCKKEKNLSMMRKKVKNKNRKKAVDMIIELIK